MVSAFKVFKEIQKEDKRFTTLVKSLLWQGNSADYLVFHHNTLSFSISFSSLLFSPLV